MLKLKTMFKTQLLISRQWKHTLQNLKRSQLMFQVSSSQASHYCKHLCDIIWVNNNYSVGYLSSKQCMCCKKISLDIMIKMLTFLQTILTSVYLISSRPTVTALMYSMQNCLLGLHYLEKMGVCFHLDQTGCIIIYL